MLWLRLRKRFFNQLSFKEWAAVDHVHPHVPEIFHEAAGVSK